MSDVDTFIKNVERATIDDTCVPALLQEAMFMTEDVNVLTKLTYSPSGLRVLIGSLNSFVANEKLVELTTYLLYNCVTVPAQKAQKTKAMQAVSQGFGAKILFTLIPKYDKNDQILQQTTALLAKLCKVDSKMSTLARLSGGLAALIAILKDPLRVARTLNLALELLGLLALSDQNKSVMHRHELLSLVITLARRYTHVQLQEERSSVLNPALTVLRNICTGNKQYSRDLVTRGGVAMLLELLQPSDTGACTYQQALDLLTIILSGQNTITVTAANLTPTTSSSSGDGPPTTSGGGSAINGTINDDHDVNVYKSQLVSQILSQVERKSDDELADITTALMRFQGINDLPLPEDELGAFWEYPIAEEVGPSQIDYNADYYSQFSPELTTQQTTTIHDCPPCPENAPKEVFFMRPIKGNQQVPPSAITATPPPQVPEFILEASSELKRVVVQRQLKRLKDPSTSQRMDTVYDNPPSIQETSLPILPPDSYPLHGSMPSSPTSPASDKQQPATPTSNRSTSKNSTTTQTIAPLTFNSQFECGNLRNAIRVNEKEYDIILQSDINSPTHIQWFLFAVEGMQAGVTYHLHIINMIKGSSASTQGQRPLLLSEKLLQAVGTGWHRVGHDIMRLKNSYTKRKLPTLDSDDEQDDIKKSTTTTTTTGSTNKDGSQATYVTLHFSVSFPYTNDRCFLAFGYPYTYSDLQRYIHWNIPAQFPNFSKYCRNQILTKTLGGNVCNLITITNFDEDAPIKMHDRRMCFFSARVHPAETPASWMMQGVLDKLLDENNVISQQLRNQFIFKICPMLNPDGVANGHTRCNLAGKDLNRTWLDPDRVAQPTIWHWKNYIQHVRFTEKRPVLILCDLHGHSRAQQIFMYGCVECKDPAAIAESIAYVYPKLCSQAVQFFWIDRCNWAIQKIRETTGRVVGWRQLQIPLSYTVEASMCGGKNVPPPTNCLQSNQSCAQPEKPAKHVATHFNAQHYITMGHSLVTTLLQLSLVVSDDQCSITPKLVAGAPDKAQECFTDEALTTA